jgi:hypothetical protein
MSDLRYGPDPNGDAFGAARGPGRSTVLELAKTHQARLTANALLSVIPGSRHAPGNIPVPPPPDALCDWEPIGYPGTVVCADDDDLRSGFHSFGVKSVLPGAGRPDLFVIAHGERLVERAVTGTLGIVSTARWFVLMMETTQDWMSGRIEVEPREDGGASILAPYEWWTARVDMDCPKAQPRWDLTAQAHILLSRLGVPRPLDTVLFYEIR